MPSVKFYHKSEIRRFPASSASDFVSLWKKVEGMYPELGCVTHNLVWKDSDGDKIVLGGDEDLQEAYNHLENDVLRLSVEPRVPVVPAPKSESEVTPIEVDIGQPTPTVQNSPIAENQNNTQSGTKHPSVICDNCEREIDGIRFKCVLCRDYDLCKACEDQHVHDHHPMLRIVSPLDSSWKVFFNRATIMPRLIGATVNQQSLTKVGEMVTSFLNQLGLDADFEIRPPRHEENLETGDQKKKEAETTTAATNQGSIDNISEPMGQNPEQPIPDWELLDSTVNNNTEQNQNTGNGQQPPQIYPHISVPDMMDIALGQMQAMGFSNENGFLAEMLRRNHGDISAVLDALQHYGSH